MGLSYRFFVERRASSNPGANGCGLPGMLQSSKERAKHSPIVFAEEFLLRRPDFGVGLGRLQRFKLNFYAAKWPSILAGPARLQRQD